MKTSRLLVGWLLLLALAPLAATAAAGEEPRDVRRPKKLISVGWDLFSDTKWIREHLAEMETRPFDGIALSAVGRRDDGKPQPLLAAFSRNPWKYEWFAGAEADLKACRFQKLTDNFVLVGANPGDVDWFDDEGWRTIVEHFRIAARLAKAGGLRGIGFDPEPYAPPHAAFTYKAQAGRDRRTFDEYAAKARERGREVMKAVAAEYPNITILSFFLNSICGSATGHADPRPLLAGQGYGLLPAFVDGWLDAAPTTVTMVDGHESSYLYNNDAAFLEAANLIRGACQELVSPENRAKYRAQVQTSFGIYLDAYVNPPTSQWYVEGKGGPRVDRLRANVTAAVRAADEYVWVYGEKCRWWPTPNKSVTEKSWPEALPGCEDALRYARAPVDWAAWKMAQLAKGPGLANLLANGDFSQAKPGAIEPAAGAAGDSRPKGRSLPASWLTWQDDKSKGTFALDPDVGGAAKGAARLSGMADGCYLQRVKAAPGKRFAVGAVRKMQGRGDALLIVRWQTADEKWVAEVKDVHLSAAGPRDAWGKCFGVVEVPEGAANLVVLLLARGQPSAEDVAWFDDVHVYALD